MAGKIYGVFHICYSIGSSSAAEKNIGILSSVFDRNFFIAERNKKFYESIYGDNAKEYAKNFAADCRESWRYARSFSRGPRMSRDVAIVHECDNNGMFKPTKAELKKAVQWYLDNHKNWAIDAKIKNWAKDNKVEAAK